MKKQIDRFILVEALSEGGAGSVYRADEVLPGDIKRPVALKMLPPLSASDQAGRERFFGEIKLLVTLGSHPNVVTIHAIGMADNLPWIAMEYLPETVAQRIAEQPAPAGEVARLIEHIAQGLSAMHGLTPPLLHNDLKPANVLVAPCSTYKIADFGLASLATAERTRAIGTVRYSSPELINREFGQICPATDLYALGHMAYEMALGGKLYRQQFPQVFGPHQSNKDGSPQAWMAWHCSVATRPAAVSEVRADFPDSLSRVIAKLMSKPLADRYTAASEVLADLRQGSAASLPTPMPAAAGKGFTILPETPATPAPANAPTARGPRPAPAAPSPAPASGGGEMYYVRFRGRLSGPYDLAALQRAIKQGHVSRLHQISTDRVNWRGIDSIEGA